MLTSHIYALNCRFGHLASPPVLKGHPPDGESFNVRQKRKKITEKRKGKEEGRQTEGVQQDLP